MAVVVVVVVVVAEQVMGALHTRMLASVSREMLIHCCDVAVYARSKLFHPADRKRTNNILLRGGRYHRASHVVAEATGPRKLTETNA